MEAWKIQVGMRLDPSTVGGPSQQVTAVEARPNGIHIVTLPHRERHVFLPFDHVYFPRRKPGEESVNWIGRDIDIRQLYVGDLINPHESDPMDLDPRDVEAWEDEYDTEIEYRQAIRAWASKMALTGKGQYVEKITQTPLAQNATFLVYTKDRTTGRRNRYMAFIGVPLQVPGPYERPIPPKSKTTIFSDIKWCGPYYWQGDLSRKAYFAVHPTGHGRWPRAIAEYDPMKTGQMRPPRTDIKRGADSRTAQEASAFPLLTEWCMWQTPGPYDKKRKTGMQDPEMQNIPFTPHPKDPRYFRRHGAVVLSRLPGNVLTFRANEEFAELERTTDGEKDDDDNDSSTPE
jgi:hypothetical protein